MTSEQAWSNFYCCYMSPPPIAFLAMNKPLLWYKNLIWEPFASKISQLFLHHNYHSSSTFLSVGIVDIFFLIWGLFAKKTSWLFLYHNVLFQLFICGNSQYLFPKCWSFDFTPLAVCYELFTSWNQRQLDFFSIEHNNMLQFSSEKPVSYFWE